MTLTGALVFRVPSISRVNPQLTGVNHFFGPCRLRRLRDIAHPLGRIVKQYLFGQVWVRATTTRSRRRAQLRGLVMFTNLRKFY